MLANPIFIPVYADPVHWLIAFVAMAAEIGVELWGLRRLHVGANLRDHLILINLVTWGCFLVAVDAMGYVSGGRLVAGLVALELAVIAVEAVLIHAVTQGRLWSRRLACRPLSFRAALGVSALGNTVSIAVSLAVPLLVWLLPR